MSTYNPEIQEESDVLVQETESNKLILFNDDSIMFEDVVEGLMEVCGHTLQQAEQCTLIAHTRGKYAVKEGEYEELEIMAIELGARGITVEIQ